MSRQRTPRNRITQAKRIMVASLKESGCACYCGEPYLHGRPCVECRMIAFVADVDPYLMCTANLHETVFGPLPKRSNG